MQITQVAAANGLSPSPDLVLLGKTLLNLEHLTTTLAPDLDLRSVLHEHLLKIMRYRALRRLKPSSVASQVLDVADMAQRVPRQLSKLLDVLADNRFTVNVDAFDELRFASSLQKIANRVTVGLIVASLIIGAALIMRVETEAQLWGYPAFAMALFLLAALLGVGLVLTVLWSDRER